MAAFLEILPFWLEWSITPLSTSCGFRTVERFFSLRNPLPLTAFWPDQLWVFKVWYWVLRIVHCWLSRLMYFATEMICGWEETLLSAKLQLWHGSRGRLIGFLHAHGFQCDVYGSSLTFFTFWSFLLPMARIKARQRFRCANKSSYCSIEYWWVGSQIVQPKTFASQLMTQFESTSIRRRYLQSEGHKWEYFDSSRWSTRE